MGQRLVLKTDKKEIPLTDLLKFVKTATDYGLKPSQVSAKVGVVKQEVTITLDLPLRVRVAEGKKVVVRAKTAKKKAIEKQIEEHKEKKEQGESEGYVPPVGRKTAPKPQKIKCPVCNVRKPVQKINKVRVIKPHVSKGEPCPGSGQQV